jgi:hypothetical protein
MFGALNRIIGRLDAETPQPSSNAGGDNSYGFQVLRNKDPDLPLEPWFDFIIGINGHLIVSTELYALFACDECGFVLLINCTGRYRPESVRNGNPQLCWLKCFSRNLERKGWHGLFILMCMHVQFLCRVNVLMPSPYLSPLRTPSSGWPFNSPLCPHHNTSGMSYPYHLPSAQHILPGC